MPRKVKTGTRFTVNQAADELGFDEKTVKSRMVAAGFKVSAGKMFTVKDFFDGIQGTLERERILDLRQKRDEREEKRAKRLGTLVELNEALKIIAETFGPIRSAFLSAGAECSARCNPDNPGQAREVLEQWSDEKLALVRKEIEAGEETTEQ